MIHALSSPRLRRPAPGPWSRLWAALRLQASRRALADLDAHMLDDIGLTRDQARREALRPLWDAPDHWQTRL